MTTIPDNENKLTVVFNAVVEVIKWYNKQKEESK